MADKILHGDRTAGLTLYFQVWDSDGAVWNGSAFESYNVSNWATYDTALTEQGSSMIYVGTFSASIAAGLYTLFTLEQIGASPAEGDTIVGVTTQEWDGSAFLAVKSHGDTNWGTVSSATIAAAVLSTPANTIGANASGEVTVAGHTAQTGDNYARIGVAGAGLTDLGGMSAGMKAEVNTEADTALTDYGANTTTPPTVAAIADAVLDELTAGHTTAGSLSKAIIDILGDTNELQGDDVPTLISGLNDLDAAGIKAAVQATIIDGSVDIEEALKRILALLGGKVVRTGTAPEVYEFYAEDDSTVVVTTTTQSDGSGRTN